MIFGTVSSFIIITLLRLYQLHASIEAIRFGDLYELYHWLGFYVLNDILSTIEYCLWNILTLIPFYKDLRVLAFIGILVGSRTLTKISYYPIIKPWLTKLTNLTIDDVKNVKKKLSSSVAEMLWRSFFSTTKIRNKGEHFFFLNKISVLLRVNSGMCEDLGITLFTPFVTKNIFNKKIRFCCRNKKKWKNLKKRNFLYLS